MILEIDRSQTQQRIDFGEYLNGLYSYAMMLSRNSTEAEDLVQETYLRAFRTVGRLRHDGSVKSWLFTILRNIWLNQLRKRWATPDLIECEANELLDAARDPLTEHVNRLEREQVQSAIQQLPLRLREIIILREYECLSYQEIAAVLNCPPDTVISRLARARSKLRNLLFGGLVVSHLRH